MRSKSASAQIGLLILATSIIQLANGFFGTFISLRIALEGFDGAMAGLVLSSYFAGFTVGALRCERIIGRIGHIRAYAAFAGMVVAATALMPLLQGPLAWSPLRAIIGFGCSGLFIATESWLNAKAEPTERGRIFSVYMLGTFLALALGQLLIGHADIDTSGPFNGIAALFAVALVLVSTTRADPPRKTMATKLPFTRLPRAAPVAVAGCAVSGFLSASFYSLVPAWMQGEGIARETIALFMLIAVLGGLAFQIPVGRLSDRFDRRLVLTILSAGFAVTAILVVNLPHSRAVILPAAAILGGFMSTLYPVCVANAHDQMPADQVVAVSGQLILISGIGSVLGPLAGTIVMAHLGIDGLFYFMAAIALLLACTAMAGRFLAKEPLHQERTFEILSPQAATLAHDQVDAL
ncbi:MFS transporter [Bordetella sp. N]|uniref:MFS transporter n=1 Tax=Bordetella sp. N TaxID=1746199 RepID=UPI0007098F62|nr:MFS transporter [Bordetella sp. N]ALM85901.1 MFS transporter [Bordetella sp. N]